MKSDQHDLSGEDGKFPNPREDLLTVAIELFAVRGFKGTSIRDIADSLGVSVSNIYHYFGNKEGLWLAILEHSVKELPKKLAAATKGIADPQSRFKELLRAHLEFSAEHQKESQIFFIDQSMFSADGKKKHLKMQKNILDLYVKELTALKQSGRIKAENVKIVAFNVLALVNWHLRWYRQDGPLSADQVQEYVIEFALHGIFGAPE